jgi:hypothetical protein
MISYEEVEIFRKQIWTEKKPELLSVRLIENKVNIFKALKTSIFGSIQIIDN